MLKFLKTTYQIHDKFVRPAKKYDQIVKAHAAMEAKNAEILDFTIQAR